MGKTAAKVVAKIIGIVYMTGVMVTMGSLGYENFRENGFIGLLKGAHPSGLYKAALWPITVLVNSRDEGNNITAQGRETVDLEAVMDNLVHFRYSIELRNAAMKFLNTGLSAEVVKLSNDELETALQLLEKCSDECKKVKDEYLRIMHIELPWHYRNEFEKGVNLFLDGFRKDSAEMVMEGQILLHEFGEWYTPNVDQAWEGK